MFRKMKLNNIRCSRLLKSLIEMLMALSFHYQRINNSITVNNAQSIFCDPEKPDSLPSLIACSLAAIHNNVERTINVHYSLSPMYRIQKPNQTKQQQQTTNAIEYEAMPLTFVDYFWLPLEIGWKMTKCTAFFFDRNNN